MEFLINGFNMIANFLNRSSVCVSLSYLKSYNQKKAILLMPIVQFWPTHASVIMAKKIIYLIFSSKQDRGNFT